MKARIAQSLPYRDIYEEALRRYVCSRCIDFGEDGLCHGPDPAGCAIFRFLPELVEIAKRLQDPKIEPYVEELRRHICVNCRQSAEGRCPLRDALDCGLERYLPLVLDAIEEAEEKIAEIEWDKWRQL